MASLATLSAVDVLVYGGTPGGIAAAVTAAGNGASVQMVVAPGGELGGMSAGGLGWDDVGIEGLSPAVYGTASIYANFTRRVEAHYASISAAAARLSHKGTRHEPHVARSIFAAMLAEAGVQVMLNGSVSTVTRSGSGAITTVTFDVGDKTAIVVPTIAIDASYYGDLLAAAGAATRIGRESRSTFGELNAGVVFTKASVGGSVFLKGSTGESSPRVPAMTWRMCFTTNSSNMVSLTAPPPGYNRSTYVGYLHDRQAGRISSVFQAWSSPRALPPAATKFDMNCNPRPLGFVWVGSQKEAIISANRTERASLVAELRQLALGLLFFQQNDPDVPPTDRAEAQRYGLCADEFIDNGHFPTELYVREARRLVPRRWFTELDMVPLHPSGRPPLRADAVAVGSFAVDAFPCSAQRPAAVSGATLEGYIDMQTALTAPHTLPASIMLPPAVPNLLAPVAVGASHVGFSSVRLEPTWMLLGGAAGMLAALAVAHGEVPGAVPLLKLQHHVTAFQPLVWYDDLDPATMDQAVLTAMQVLGPHGVADDLHPSVHAAAGDALVRSVAAHWLYGVALALNSTVGSIAEAPAAPTGRRWHDFGPDDPFFDSAVLCATMGVFPPPSTDVDFHPHRGVSSAELDAWADKLLGRSCRHCDTLPERINESWQASSASLSRGQAAVALLARVL